MYYSINKGEVRTKDLWCNLFVLRHLSNVWPTSTVDHCYWPTIIYFPVRCATYEVFPPAYTQKKCGKMLFTNIYRIYSEHVITHIIYLFVGYANIYFCLPEHPSGYRVMFTYTVNNFVYRKHWTSHIEPKMSIHRSHIGYCRSGSVDLCILYFIYYLSINITEVITCYSLPTSGSPSKKKLIHIKNVKYIYMVTELKNAVGRLLPVTYTDSDVYSNVTKVTRYYNSITRVIRDFMRIIPN